MLVCLQLMSKIMLLLEKYTATTHATIVLPLHFFMLFCLDLPKLLSCSDPYTSVFLTSVRSLLFLKRCTPERCTRVSVITKLPGEKAFASFALLFNLRVLWHLISSVFWVLLSNSPFHQRDSFILRILASECSPNA